MSAGDPRLNRSLAFDADFTSLSIGVGNKFGTLFTGYPFDGPHGPHRTNAPFHSLDYVDSGQLSITGSPELRITADYDSTRTVEPPGMGTLNCWKTGLLTTATDANTGGNNFLAQAGDYLLTRVQLPSANGAWPAYFTWDTDGPAPNGEVDVFEYHPDNPNVLEFTNHVAGTVLNYSNPTLVFPGAWIWIGCIPRRNCVRWFVGTDAANMTLAFDDAVGIGTDWSVNLVLNQAIADGFWHPAPSGEVSFYTAFSHMQVWR